MKVSLINDITALESKEKFNLELLNAKKSILKIWESRNFEVTLNDPVQYGLNKEKNQQKYFLNLESRNFSKKTIKKVKLAEQFMLNISNIIRQCLSFVKCPVHFLKNKMKTKWHFVKKKNKTALISARYKVVMKKSSLLLKPVSLDFEEDKAREKISNFHYWSQFINIRNITEAAWKTYAMFLNWFWA